LYTVIISIFIGINIREGVHQLQRTHPGMWMLLPAIHFGQLLNNIFESTILHLLTFPRIFNCGGGKVLQWMMPSYVWARVQFLPIMPSTTGIQVWQGMRLLHWYNFNSDVLDKEEGQLEMLHSILAQHDYQHQVNSWHAQVFHLRITCTSQRNQNGICEHEDKKHIFKVTLSFLVITYVSIPLYNGMMCLYL